MEPNWIQINGEENALDYGGTFLDKSGTIYHWDKPVHYSIENNILVFVVDVEKAPVCWADYQETADWLGVETLKGMSKKDIILAIAGYHGWYPFDHKPKWYSRSELRKLMEENGVR